ncbi:Alpha/Beta hydrolase protein [Microdochium trichocladiopsis]|uniref:Alpha/Beta hydrolase protein n=1 Tax=Microdochium trichocladiopsis TaxID=1682393 RepID=A0A9P8YC96_9PEZI|nr:Alpha/Beta hydrolase protein [Microdochium trichocladiopsis]KAH7035736.1 Alpha/Beta hydrolase protein [Microdochium trichocladiopsis]
MQLLEIDILYNEVIPLSDGLTLSAQIWLPVEATTAAPARVPAILEYLPYRKRDGTAVRDAMNHPYVASRGYACVRVDMRGAGDSEGLLLGEYLKQEQDDALEVIDWIASQKWCTGSVGMIGISWGGFNSLQVAARRPPQLKAIISICSTDDRFGDDIHYKGGCLLTENLTWAASMLAINSSPPDPALVGEDKWRKMWLKRLESGGFFAKEWHEHQHRDAFWKHASIGQSYADIECATYLVGGWADPYTNTIFRMLENLKCPRKGLVGPWGHKYPNFGVPGPQIGFLQEAVRWWDYWLKGEDKTGIMEEPMLRSYLQDPWPPAPYDEFRPGRWVAEECWSDEEKLKAGVVMGLAPGRLTNTTGASDEKLSICSPQNLGFSGGRWLVFGIEGEGPGDQRAEAGGSLVFDTKALDEPMDLHGPAELKLRIASNKPNALVAATLSEVLPNGGGVTRVSYGVLNLTHRNGSDNGPELLEPYKFYDVSFKLNHFGQRIGKGSQLRLALSSTYFPMVWPSPETTTLTIDCMHSSIGLPLRRDNPLDSKLEKFRPAINGTLPKTDIRKATHKNFVRHDWDSNRTELCVYWDDGKWEVDATGWKFGNIADLVVSVSPNDPLSATVEQKFDREFGRGDLDLRTNGWTKMKMTKTDMLITAYVEAWDAGKLFFQKNYSVSVPRSGL